MRMRAPGRALMKAMSEGLTFGGDQQVVFGRDDFHDGFAGPDHAANGVTSRRIRPPVDQAREFAAGHLVAASGELLGQARLGLVLFLAGFGEEAGAGFRQTGLGFGATAAWIRQMAMRVVSSSPFWPE